MSSRSAGFLERTLCGFAEVLERADTADRLAGSRGALQALDPRVKLAGALLLVVTAVSVRHLSILTAIGTAAVCLAAFSRIPLPFVAVRIWLPVLFFTGAIALPAIFTTPGPALFRLPLLGWSATEPGCRTAAQLLLRAETCATLVMLVVLSTPWVQVLKALRLLGLPGMAVAILGMTHRYIFLLLSLTREAFEARRARLVGPLDGAQQRRLAAAGGAALLGKSLQLAGDVHSAMQARGFRGEVRTLDRSLLRRRDWWALAVCLGTAAAALLIDPRL